jgi:hypothetical protein
MERRAEHRLLLKGMQTLLVSRLAEATSCKITFHVDGIKNQSCDCQVSADETAKEVESNAMSASGGCS